MKKLIIPMLLITALLSCKKTDDPPVLSPKSISLSQAENRIVESSNQFGFELMKKIDAAEDASTNVFISPLSIHMALAMTWNGAEGTTRDQMAEAMNFPNMSAGEMNLSYKNLIHELLSVDEKVTMEVANSIWYRNTYVINQAFIDTNTEYFDAVVQGVDFDNPNAKDIINAWVADNTHGLIEEIIQEINASHLMFLVNAIYFKGIWQNGFKKSNTEPTPFHMSTGSIKEVPTMFTKAEFAQTSAEDYHVIELPYGRGNFSMLVFLPDGETSPGEVIASLNAQEWELLTGRLGQTYETELYLPKFSYEYELEMNEVLISMGMEDAFAPSLANFSGIADADLYLSEVKHKTFVEVNEEGTEAAAVTAVGVSLTSMPAYLPVFRVDRPFVFALRETQTNTLLFLGKVEYPGE